jgi:replicative DNA helicase
MSTNDMTDQMANTPANVTPLHGDGDGPGFRSPPHNFEAEMALLGAILVNNRSFERVQEFLFAEHFADPAHARVYEACAHLIERGQIADPITLKNYFKDDEDLKAIGGQGYIAELANSVMTIQNAGDLGKEIYDCFLRRELIEIGDQVVNAAFEYEIDSPAPQQIERAEEMLFQLAEQGSAETGFRDFKTAVTGAR